MISKTQQRNLLILSLFLIIGFVIYYVFMKPEHFYGEEQNTNDNCPLLPPPTYNSIVSKYSGVGLNINPVTPEIGNINNQEQLYQIKSIPLTKNDVLGGVYAVTDDNSLTIVIQNKNDINQLWTLNQITDTQNNTVYIVKPYLQKISGVDYALQYENGTLSFRPFDSLYQSQHWLPSTSTFNKGIPILFFNPLSIYTPEFNPNGSVSGTVNNLDNQNNKQVTDVLNLVKQGVQQYMSQLNTATQNTGTISSSSIGNSSNPLNVNLTISKNNSTSSFTDVNNDGTPSPTSSVIDLLNKYESATSPDNNDDFTLYKLTDLESSIKNKTSRYSSINPNDWVYKSIGTCNCQL